MLCTEQNPREGWPVDEETCRQVVLGEIVERLGCDFAHEQDRAVALGRVLLLSIFLNQDTAPYSAQKMHRFLLTACPLLADTRCRCIGSQKALSVQWEHGMPRVVLNEAFLTEIAKVVLEFDGEE